jgi:hypothetical protein
MTLIACGAVLAVMFTANRWFLRSLARLPLTARGAGMLPLMGRLNIGIGLYAVALVVLGLLFPRI